MDQTAASGNSRGGGVRFLISNYWCTEVEHIVSSCSTNLEFLDAKMPTTLYAEGMNVCFYHSCVHTATNKHQGTQ